MAKWTIRPAAVADIEPVLAFWAGSDAVPSSTDNPGTLRRLAEAGCRRVTALVTTAHEYAVSFWNAAGYGLDPTMARHVKMLTA